MHAFISLEKVKSRKNNIYKIFSNSNKNFHCMYFTSRVGIASCPSKKFNRKHIFCNHRNFNVFDKVRVKRKKGILCFSGTYIQTASPKFTDGYHFVNTLIHHKRSVFYNYLFIDVQQGYNILNGAMGTNKKKKDSVVTTN